MTKSPSYHDVTVYVNGKAHKISDNHGYELCCSKAGGWQLWFRPASNWTGVVSAGACAADADLLSRYGSNKPVLIGGEFDSNEFRIEVAGIDICVGGGGAEPQGGGGNG